MQCVHIFQDHLGCGRVLNMIKHWSLLKMLLEEKGMPLEFPFSAARVLMTLEFCKLDWPPPASCWFLHFLVHPLVTCSSSPYYALYLHSCRWFKTGETQQSNKWFFFNLEKHTLFKNIKMELPTITSAIVRIGLKAIQLLPCQNGA